MLNCTARNLNTLLFRASASFDNKIKTQCLILPSCEDQIPLSIEFTGTPPSPPPPPTGSISASCLQTVLGTNYQCLFLPSLLYELFSGQTPER